MKITERQLPYKRKGFPIGIFLLLFLVEAVIALSANAFYFLRETRNGIAEIEKYTRGYSITLAEAFAEIASSGYTSKNYSVLKTLFSEKISANMINEGFFTLTNGELKAHTSSERSGEVRGNIANDEFFYNLDLILKPAVEKTSETLFSDYNIIDREVPYGRDERRYLKDYIYTGIDSSGWLVSRAVFVKKKPVGTVNLLISKDRVFQLIEKNFTEGKKYSLAALGIAYAVSLVVSIIVFIRHRRIENRALASLTGDDLVMSRVEQVDEESIAILDSDSDLMPLEAEDGAELESEPVLLHQQSISRTPITIELLDELESERVSLNDPAYSDTIFREEPPSPPRRFRTDSELLRGKTIKDPVPVTARERRNGTH